MVEIRRATKEDAEALAPRLRVADVRELAACGAESPLAALYAGLRLSGEECFAAVDEGRVVAMYGLAAFHGEPHALAAPWALGSDDLGNWRITMIRTARRAVLRWSKLYALANVVHAEHTDAIRWLEILGFKMGEPFAFSVTGAKLIPFTMERQE